MNQNTAISSQHPEQNNVARNPEELLPLSEITLYLLIAVRRSDHLHGYGMKKAVEKFSNGRIKLGASSLYGTIGEILKLQRKNFIVCTAKKLDPESGMERRYHRLTEEGERIVKGVKVHTNWTSARTQEIAG
jgi:DNA-binding PadR family transcriptional regulator